MSWFYNKYQSVSGTMYHIWFGYIIISPKVFTPESLFNFKMFIKVYFKKLKFLIDY